MQRHSHNLLVRVGTLLLLIGLVPATPVASAELTRKESDLFETHVRPTLVAHCIQCHGESKQESGLRLTSMTDLLKGGDSGPAIVPGEPQESLLVEALRYESYEMPPSGQLEDDVIAGITAWIEAGAPWPQGLVLKPTPKITEKDREWWCYQPISNPDVPTVKNESWCRNEIDYFILARLEQEGVTPAKEADPRLLVRRAHFAITGLPPDDQAATAVDAGSSGYEALVDRLLSTSAYGENQARFWLDLVRYADSDGYNADHSRPEAHHYRDYVIRSFNADKPYDRFVIEQLAGDEIDPGNRDALIATMYLRHWIYEWNQRDVEGQWQEILSDITETTSDVFLAQGIKCARCHDHKFDPLLQKDYYRMQAFFAAFQPREDLPVADVEQRTKYYRQLRKWEEATEEIRARLHEIERPVLLAHATREGVDKFVDEIQQMLNARECERSPYEEQIASLASRQFDLHPDKLAEWLDEDLEAERQELLQQLAEFDSLKPAPLPTLKFVASDVGPVAPPTYIPDVEDAEPIAPGFPTLLDDKPAEISPPPEALQSTGRRTALARWIADPKNPLTARVIVNRVWQQHFGRGLVETCSDFGHLGAPPTHPELLDWLATRFISDGWSLKKLHRLILTSATYRQSSQRPMDEHLARLDPANTLLWRMNPRRLSGEEITDTILSATGELTDGKRAIYKPVKRNKLDPLLSLFDFPDRTRSQGERHRTTTSPQALMLLNASWVHERAAAMTKDLQTTDANEFVQDAYRRLFFRQPSPQELALAMEFMTAYRSTIPEPKAPKSVDAMPDGAPALALDAKNPERVAVPYFRDLPNADLTVEAIVVLQSLYPDASVRTIVANWSGNHQSPGWSLGVTSTKSAYQPRNLILQLIGTREDGKRAYEVIASNLRLELNKPYYVAVSVDADDASEQGVTFLLQDLSSEGAEPHVANVTHHAVRDIQAKQPVTIGGRANGHHWDGLIQNVRLHAAPLNREQLITQNTSNLLFDIQLGNRTRPGQDASGNERHALLGNQAATKQQQVRQALLHALLNSNELIYVD